jgi:hypothetical protein
MFCTYMQEVNLKVLSFSIYFTYFSVLETMYAQEISASRLVEMCLGVVVSEISHYFTHIPYFLKTTPKTLFFLPLAVTHNILAASLSLTETDQALLSAVRGCVLAPSIPYMSRGGSRACVCFFLCPSMKE